MLRHMLTLLCALHLTLAPIAVRGAEGVVNRHAAVANDMVGSIECPAEGVCFTNRRTQIAGDLATLGIVDVFAPYTWAGVVVDVAGLGAGTLVKVGGKTFVRIGERLHDFVRDESGAIRVPGLGGSATNTGLTAIQRQGILREASQLGQGNLTLAGRATRAEATDLGEAWVGPGYRTASDGRTLVSADGTRTFRPPTPKPNSPFSETGVQVNFETRELIDGRWTVRSNAHLDVSD